MAPLDGPRPAHRSRDFRPSRHPDAPNRKRAPSTANPRRSIILGPGRVVGVPAKPRGALWGGGPPPPPARGTQRHAARAGMKHHAGARPQAWAERAPSEPRAILGLFEKATIAMSRGFAPCPSWAHPQHRAERPPELRAKRESADSRWLAFQTALHTREGIRKSPLWLAFLPRSPCSRVKFSNTPWRLWTNKGLSRIIALTDRSTYGG